MLGKFTFNILFTIFLLVASEATSFSNKTLNDPTLRFINTTLPYVRDGSSAVYDGNDSIYIIGGYNGTEFCSTDILKFTISTEEIVLVASTPKPACFGQAVWDKTSESIYYLSEDVETQLPNINSMVLKFNVQTVEAEEVGELKGRGNAFSAILDENQRAIIVIGGSSGVGNNSDKDILKYDLTTDTVTVVGTFQGKSLYSPLSVPFINSLGLVLVLGETSIYRYIHNSACGTSMEALDVNLPTNVIRGAITYSTEVNLAYVVGGSDNGSYDILEFNPLSLETRSIKLPDFPQGLVDAASVYIEQINAIYFFGGFALSNGEYFNSIGVLQF